MICFSFLFQQQNHIFEVLVDKDLKHWAGLTKGRASCFPHRACDGGNSFPLWNSVCVLKLQVTSRTKYQKDQNLGLGCGSISKVLGTQA